MSHRSAQNPWLLPVKINASSRLRLFCFPYAGAGGQVYSSWSGCVPGPIEVWAIQPPGHGTRLLERPLRSISQLAEGALGAIRPLLNKPFVFFGHSMGGLLAFQVAKQLVASDDRPPAHLLISGVGPPDLPMLHDPLHLLSTPEFTAKIREYNGTPRGVLENTELLDLVIPVLRADFEACETYSCTDTTALNVPISAFGGAHDRYVPSDYLEAWGRHTKQSFTVHQIPGDHFYLHSSAHRFFEALRRVLEIVLETEKRSLAGFTSSLAGRNS